MTMLVEWLHRLGGLSLASVVALDDLQALLAEQQSAATKPPAPRAWHRRRAPFSTSVPGKNSPGQINAAGPRRTAAA
ncbi:hypothetical protein MJ575_24430 [Klebsiella pneumoniae]|nr:hypothetical protein MJ575_24430 [Klebsiella pneumoniae]